MGTENGIFLTGFPGFIATRLVERLALDRPHFFFLVQPSFRERADAAIKSISEASHLPVDHFQIFEGDITEPGFGLGHDDLEIVRTRTNFLFHLAAIYDLAVDREVALRVNLGGTRIVNELVLSLRNLRRYHYVSTCYVSGKRTGLIRESELDHEAGFRNYYEETKYLAELEVAALKDKVPLTIHRPSVVCGDSNTGETAKYDGVYYLILYLLKQPNLLSMVNIGNNDVRLNLVPVDFVVDAMAALLDDDRAAGATIQLADPSPLTSSQLFEAISKKLVGRGSLVTMPPKIVQTTLTLPVSPRITGLPTSAVPYFFIEQTYDTAMATDLLGPHNIRCPTFTDYVDHLIEFVKEHPKL